MESARSEVRILSPRLKFVKDAFQTELTIATNLIRLRFLIILRRISLLGLLFYFFLFTFVLRDLENKTNGGLNLKKKFSGMGAFTIYAVLIVLVFLVAIIWG
jgi:hypothetical protein